MLIPLVANSFSCSLYFVNKHRAAFFNSTPLHHGFPRSHFVRRALHDFNGVWWMVNPFF